LESAAMENVTVNILGCAIVFFFGFYAGIIYRRKSTKENFKPSHNNARDEILLCANHNVCEDRDQGRCTYLDGACTYQRKT
jgi:hypothetical protein